MTFKPSLLHSLIWKRRITLPLKDSCQQTPHRRPSSCHHPLMANQPSSAFTLQRLTRSPLHPRLSTAEPLSVTWTTLNTRHFCALTASVPGIFSPLRSPSLSELLKAQFKGRDAKPSSLPTSTPCSLSGAQPTGSPPSAPFPPHSACLSVGARPCHPVMPSHLTCPPAIPPKPDKPRSPFPRRRVQSHRTGRVTVPHSHQAHGTHSISGGICASAQPIFLLATTTRLKRLFSPNCQNPL